MIISPTKDLSNSDSVGVAIRQIMSAGRPAQPVLYSQDSSHSRSQSRLPVRLPGVPHDSPHSPPCGAPRSHSSQHRCDACVMSHGSADMDPWGEVEDERWGFSLYGTGVFPGNTQDRGLSCGEERGEDSVEDGDEVLYQQAFATFVGARNRLRQKELMQPKAPPSSKGSAPVPGKNPTSRATGARLRCFLRRSADHLIPQCPHRSTHGLPGSVKPSVRDRNEHAYWVDVQTAFATFPASDGKMILDTGATSTAAGKRWWKEHCAWLRALGREDPKTEPAFVPFKFGNGAVAYSREVGVCEIALGGDFFPFRCHLVDGPTPPLLSCSSLGKMRAILDVAHATLRIGASGKMVSLDKRAGHLRLNVMDVCVTQGGGQKTRLMCRSVPRVKLLRSWILRFSMYGRVTIFVQTISGVSWNLLRSPCLLQFLCIGYKEPRVLNSARCCRPFIVAGDMWV